jgi:hypothetical protein
MFSNYFRIVTYFRLYTRNTSFGLVLLFGISINGSNNVGLIIIFKPKINEIEVFQSKRIPIILTFVMLFITSLEVKTQK